MKDFFKRHSVLLVVLIILVVVAIVYSQKKNSLPDWTTGTIEVGTVSQIVSVSGTVESKNTAELSFPISGIVEAINIKKGQLVNVGDMLMYLKYNDLKADYQRAVSALNIAEADYSEVLTGAREEEREVAKTKVEIAKEELDRATKEQNTKVENAYRTLLSSNLIAKPTDSDDDSIAPTISGTYTCKEGTYSLKTYRSESESGYAYNLNGLEKGTYIAYTESASSFGNCGLFIQFDSSSKYGNSEWIIEIPNKESSLYPTNLNTYNLAVTTRENALASLKQNLKLAEENENLTTADPRTETITKSQAKIDQAKSDLSRISSQISDHIMYAPFSGKITDIKPTVGETVSTEPVVTMVANDNFEISTLIPEIDITKISLGQKADLVFDAQSDQTLTGAITFISPLAKTIAGVSYFETTIILDNPVNWLRGGLNADIDIIIEKKEEVLRLPKRFLIEENGQYFVLTPKNNQPIKTPVMVDFIGNDGYVSIQGLEVGSTVIAP
ncbi:MAG: HlyD family efflux transporter periplasmic adaptor subunit [Candidatus Paceibacterota bacterium]